MQTFISLPQSPKITKKRPWLSEHRALSFSFLLKLLSSFPTLVFCYMFVCVKDSGILCSQSKKDSKRIGDLLMSYLSLFLKEFRQLYGMAMVSTLVNCNYFFWFAFQMLFFSICCSKWDWELDFLYNYSSIDGSTIYFFRNELRGGDFMNRCPNI